MEFFRSFSGFYSISSQLYICSFSGFYSISSQLYICSFSGLYSSSSQLYICSFSGLYSSSSQLYICSFSGLYSSSSQLYIYSMLIQLRSENLTIETGTEFNDFELYLPFSSFQYFPILPPPLSTFPPSFDCITFMIIDHLLSNFVQLRKKIQTFFFGASRIIATRVSNYCLVFNIKKIKNT